MADMHEMAITQKVFNMVVKEAEKAGAKKVFKIELVIGELTGIVPDSVEFYLEFLSEGTIVEGAEVSIEGVPPMVLCRNCNQTSIIPKKETWKCPHCEKGSMEIIAGRELKIKSIGVD